MIDRFKFRAYDETYKRFLYRTLIDPKEASLMWEQCTGLKDKNGRLIYEGDIVKETSFDEDSCAGREFEEKSVVCFGGGDYPCSFTMKSKRFYRGFALLNYGINRVEIEVIGNIHEKPELLKEEA